MDATQRNGLWARCGAVLYEPFLRHGERLVMRERRAELVGQARGRVVEIGAGTGLNIPHYSSAADEVILTEPVPAMFRRVRGRAAGHAPMRVVQASAETLPVEDGSVDTVVSTMVLCTVAEVEPALAEIARVLRPGGRLLFCEHVRAADPKLARRQSRYARPWAVFAQGCRCDRDTLDLVTERFHVEWVTDAQWRGMPSVVRPLVVGAATTRPLSG